MSTQPFALTSQLARAARALVGVSATHAADAAGLTKSELRAFEKLRATLTAEQEAALKGALEDFGAHFIADGRGGRGHGVQLKFSAAKTERVESWEDEGGLPADDDV